MAGTGPLYTPAASAAQGPAFTGQAVQDAVSIAGYDPGIASAKDVPYKVQNEILALIKRQYAGGGALQVRNVTGATLAAGPVSISGYYGLDSISGNPIFTITAATATGNTPANALLLASLATATSGIAYAGGTFTSALNTVNTAIGAPVYVGLNGGITADITSVTATNAFVQIVGYVETQAAAGAIAGLLQNPIVFGTEWLQVDAVTTGTDDRTTRAMVRALIRTEQARGALALVEAFAQVEGAGMTALAYSLRKD